MQIIYMRVCTYFLFSGCINFRVKSCKQVAFFRKTIWKLFNKFLNQMKFSGEIYNLTSTFMMIDHSDPIYLRYKTFLKTSRADSKKFFFCWRFQLSKQKWGALGNGNSGWFFKSVRASWKYDSFFFLLTDLDFRHGLPLSNQKLFTVVCFAPFW